MLERTRHAWRLTYDHQDYDHSRGRILQVPGDPHYGTLGNDPGCSPSPVIAPQRRTAMAARDRSRLETRREFRKKEKNGWQMENPCHSTWKLENECTTGWWLGHPSEKYESQLG